METTESGASDTHMVEAGQIRKGGYIMVKGKAGKHGHAKCKFSASCIFTGATCEELCPSTHSIAVPFVNKTDYDNKISEQIKSIIEEIDGGAEIELYCTVMQ